MTASSRSSAEYREYENGVADVLGFLAGDRATVRRNVRLPSRSGGRPRQIDVLVQGRIFRLTETTMIIECKQWAERIDVKDVEAFLGMLDDVGVGNGMMMTTQGASEGARLRAEARGVSLEVVSLAELNAWSPRGTVTTSYRIPAERQAAAERALRHAGFRVAPDSGYELAGAAEVVLRLLRYYGTDKPSPEVQREQWALASIALAKIGIADPVMASNGVTMGGGTPAHRWLPVTAYGVPTRLKIIAATEAEVERELDGLARWDAAGGLPRAALSVVTPEGWPFRDLFGFWGI